MLHSTANARRQVSAVANPALDADARKLQRTCQDFESLFVKQLLGTMRKGTLGDGLLRQDVSFQVATDMYDSALAESIGRAGGIGLGQLLYKQLRTTLREPAATAVVAGAGAGGKT